MARDTETALHWIVDILEKRGIRYQIAGGFAARLYGVRRELADIDIGIPDDAFDILLPDIKEHVMYGPERYRDSDWDLKLVTLRYKGQDIDLSEEEGAKLFDKGRREWVPGGFDFSRAVLMEAYGRNVSVIRREDLIAYKQKLMREVDRLDIEALERLEKT